MVKNAAPSTSDGTVVAIRGGVVDIAFAGTVPHVNALVQAGDVALEVASLLGGGVVRCVALGPVRGLALGVRVKAGGGGIEVPVGEAVLGRMLNVFGAPLDGLPPVATAMRPKTPIQREDTREQA